MNAGGRCPNQKRSLRGGSFATLCVVMLTITAGCGGSGTSSTDTSRVTEDALVSAREMPSPWRPFTPPKPRSTNGVCNRSRIGAPQSRPLVQRSRAWAQPGPDGPIFGERIEVYVSADDAAAHLRWASEVHLPCDWIDNGSWQATLEPALGLGDAGFVYLIRGRYPTSPTFNYEAELQRGRSLVLFVMNTAVEAAAQWRALARAVWDRAESRLRTV